MLLTCGASIVFGSVLLAFLPTLHNGFVLWDDDLNLLDNPAYRGLSLAHLRWMFTTTLAGPYQPLSWLTLGLDYVVWGMNPKGYHLTSLVLHAAGTVALYVLLVAMLERERERGSDLGVAAAAVVGALFWGIHPLRVESVAWATERRDVLSGPFFVLTVLAYVRMAEAQRLGSAWRRPPWSVRSSGAFIRSAWNRWRGQRNAATYSPVRSSSSRSSPTCVWPRRSASDARGGAGSSPRSSATSCHSSRRRRG
ncbi:MAG: hypothetical protein E6J77_24820 [Deltaproteobacteria bacterium]|nr:MAG: hypothetical protein E6J77_24820 [Deltaproteobacteria bacterium]